MECDSESTGESEDEMDSCSLQYQEVDPSLLGTAVFIKNVHISPSDHVLLYVHNSSQPEDSTPDHTVKIIFIAIGFIFALTSVILINF